MRKAIAAVVLVVALAIPVGAQNLEFLEVLIKAVVEEYGIDTVIGVLEDLGYIGEDKITVAETDTRPTESHEDKLTVRSEVWEDTDGDETLVDMVISEDASCYSYIEYGRNQSFSVSDRMFWRQQFISACIGKQS